MERLGSRKLAAGICGMVAIVAVTCVHAFHPFPDFTQVVQALVGLTGLLVVGQAGLDVLRSRPDDRTSFVD